MIRIKKSTHKLIDFIQNFLKSKYIDDPKFLVLDLIYTFKFYSYICFSNSAQEIFYTKVYLVKPKGQRTRNRSLVFDAIPRKSKKIHGKGIRKQWLMRYQRIFLRIVCGHKVQMIFISFFKNIFRKLYITTITHL